MGGGSSKMKEMLSSQAYTKDMAEEGNMSDTILFKSEAEELLKTMRDPNLGIISYAGWDGMGSWMIVEHVTKIAMETHLFDDLIWLNLPTTDEIKSRLKLQMKIGESLGIQHHSRTSMDHAATGSDGDDEETGIDVHMSVKIFERLEDRKFLLVIGSCTSQQYLSKRIDLDGMGVPSVRRGVFSKVVLVGKLSEMKVDRTLKFSPEDENSNYPISDFWDLIYSEATLAAHSPSTKGYFSPETVIHLLSYFLLAHKDSHSHYYTTEPYHYYCFARKKEWMIRYCIVEELIVGELEKDEIFASEIMGTLLKELKERSILSINEKRYYYEEQKYDLIRWAMNWRKPAADFHGRRFWVSEENSSLPKEDEWGAIQRMSLLITKDEVNNSTLPSSPKCPNLSTLILRCKELDQFDFPITFFDHMTSLRVLDLAKTPIGSLPSSLSSLCNLKLLMLRNCKKVESLPATCLRGLIKLEFLDLSRCDHLNVISEGSFELMDRLRFLDLSKTKIDSLPSSIFSKLHNLQQLLLHNCLELKSLPSSLSMLVNLKKLDLSHCKSLETGVPRLSLQKLTSLEELDLSFCSKLSDIRDASFQDILPRLRKVRITNTKTPIRLSFKGCQSLETLDLSSLQKLQVLDVSNTKLKKLDLTCSWDYSLRRFDILPMTYSDILFQELNLKSHGHVGARIWVGDPHFFLSTLKCNSHLFSNSKCFNRFYIRISPYEEGHMPMTFDKFQRKIHLKRSPGVYKAIIDHSHIQTHHHFSHYTSRHTTSFNRHLEICGGNSSPRGVDQILAVTELITLLFNNFVESLSDLSNIESQWNLKECRIGSCQRMKNIFNRKEESRFLEVIWVSDLPDLTVVSHNIVYDRRSYKLLSRIYVEDCPRLENLFTSGVTLKCLETLEISNCCRLKNVFGEEAEGREEGSMPSLRSLCLLHVPKLKSVCNGFLTKLEMIQVRRCPKLRKLPIGVRLADHDINASGHSTSSSSPPTIEIRGEEEWWKNLHWDHIKDDRIMSALATSFRPWRNVVPTTMNNK